MTPPGCHMAAYMKFPPFKMPNNDPLPLFITSGFLIWLSYQTWVTFPILVLWVMLPWGYISLGYTFNSFGYIFITRIVGSYWSSICTFFWNHHIFKIVFYITSHSTMKYMVSTNFTCFHFFSDFLFSIVITTTFVESYVNINLYLFTFEVFLLYNTGCP